MNIYPDQTSRYGNLWEVKSSTTYSVRVNPSISGSIYIKVAPTFPASSSSSPTITTTTDPDTGDKILTFSTAATSKYVSLNMVDGTQMTALNPRMTGTRDVGWYDAIAEMALNNSWI